MSDSDSPTKLRSYESGRFLQAVERSALFRFGTEYAEKHLGMPEIYGNIDRGHCDESDTRIFHFRSDDVADLLSDLVSQSNGTAVWHSSFLPVFYLVIKNSKSRFLLNQVDHVGQGLIRVSRLVGHHGYGEGGALP